MSSGYRVVVDERTPQYVLAGPAETPVVDKLCEDRYEPHCGLVWADHVRPIEIEKRFYRQLLEQIASDPRRTRARRLAESGLAFWDSLQAEKGRK